MGSLTKQLFEYFFNRPFNLTDPCDWKIYLHLVVDLYGGNVGKYTSHMDAVGNSPWHNLVNKILALEPLPTQGLRTMLRTKMLLQKCQSSNHLAIECQMSYRHTPKYSWFHGRISHFYDSLFNKNSLSHLGPCNLKSLQLWFFPTKDSSPQKKFSQIKPVWLS